MLLQAQIRLGSLVAMSAIVFLVLLHGRPNHRRALHKGLSILSVRSGPRAFAGSMPARVVWAWEVPEQLQTLPATVGVAYLAETLLLGERMQIVPRRQPLRLAADAPVMAVVRIETARGFVDSSEIQAETVAQLALVAHRPGTRALQIDFDAVSSQLGFYHEILRTLRPAMPNGTALSITALASWCGEPSWLHDLPVDEAVPMLFRMGGPEPLAEDTRERYPLREPLCRGSRGFAVDEPWPAMLSALNPATRVYLFAPGPWRPDALQAVANIPLPALSEALRHAQRETLRYGEPAR
jgi:hypothetical protein